MIASINEVASHSDALILSLKAIDDAGIELWNDYKVIISRSKDSSYWVVWFVARPETPGLDITVIVNRDCKTSLLPGA
jgi:hypothetical protein